jgi:hypothetical protein
MALHDTTRADERQAELGQVRRGISGPYNPRTPAPPPAMDAEALATAVHRAGLARMRAHSDPPNVVRLLQVVSTCWYLWTVRP